jgi:hypothetical protein
MPGGLTVSAWAHLRAREGRPWLRNRIDGAALLFFGSHQHCQASWQRGRPMAVRKNSELGENSEPAKCS